MRPRRICCPEFDDTGLVPCRHRRKLQHDNNHNNLKVYFYFILTGLVLGIVIGYLYQHNCQLKIEIENMKLSQINQNSGVRPVDEDLSQQQTEDIISCPAVPETVPETVPAATLINLPKTENFVENPENVHRRAFIREMMREAWNAYTRSALGYDSLKPVTNEPNGLKGSGRSVVASMSTLWVMQLREEFEQARKWIKEEMNFGQLNENLNVFSVVTDYIGGLLSCFALTREQMLLNKAVEIAHIIRTDHVPILEINPKKKNYYIDNNNQPFTLSQIAQQLEYHYLVDITNDRRFVQPIESIWNLIRKMDKPRGLYRFWLYINNNWQFPESTRSTLWENSSEFYFNLLKSYIQTGGTNQEVAYWYTNAMNAVEYNEMFSVRQFSSTTSESVTTIVYAREYDCCEKPKYDTRFGFSSCQLGAMLSMGSKIKENGNAKYWMEMAQNITDGCQVLSDSTKTGLMPTVYDFENGKHKYHYSLSPQLAQSNFILWRLTHNQKYRDNAWKMVESIHQHCRTEGGGYSSIENVNQIPTVKTNHQPPHFLSATLKYLYLTFTDDSVLPLDQWVFNSAGHPLPICGTSDAYPKCRSQLKFVTS